MLGNFGILRFYKKKAGAHMPKLFLQNRAPKTPEPHESGSGSDTLVARDITDSQYERISKD
jgi:hypothetical protein